jgi:hypothetical protein
VEWPSVYVWQAILKCNYKSREFGGLIHTRTIPVLTGLGWQSVLAKNGGKLADPPVPRLTDDMTGELAILEFHLCEFATANKRIHLTS